MQRNIRMCTTFYTIYSATSCTICNASSSHPHTVSSHRFTGMQASTVRCIIAIHKNGYSNQLTISKDIFLLFNIKIPEASINAVRNMNKMTYHAPYIHSSQIILYHMYYYKFMQFKFRSWFCPAMVYKAENFIREHCLKISTC